MPSIPMLQKIISRGTPGPERTALSLARLFGLATGGHTRLAGRGASTAIRRYGLSADRCSRRQALIRNIRSADATIVFGKQPGKQLLDVLKSEGKPWRCFQRIKRATAGILLRRLTRWDVRTLNIIGPFEKPSRQHLPPPFGDGELTAAACSLFVETLLQAGLRPRLPWHDGPGAPVVVCWCGSCFAVVLWPRQRAWVWDGTRALWQDERDRGWVGAVQTDRSPGSERLLNTVPARFVCRVPEPCPIDLDLLATLGTYGKPAEDLLDARRFAMLKLLHLAPHWLPEATEAWITRMLAGRQRDFLGALGFPATESAVRTLARVPWHSALAWVLLGLRRLLYEPASTQILQRLPRVTSAAVGVLLDPWLREHVAWPLLCRLATDPWEELDHLEGSTYEHLRDLHAVAERGQEIGILHSAEVVVRLLRHLRHLPSPSWPKPSASLPGIPGVIEPLTDSLALYTEGREMRHCVGSYAERVRGGASLIFRILPDACLRTDRATLELSPSRTGVWEVQQLAGPQDAPATCHTRRLVDAWLFFANCDPQAGGDELRQACEAELAASLGMAPGARQALAPPRAA